MCFSIENTLHKLQLTVPGVGDALFYVHHTSTAGGALGCSDTGPGQTYLTVPQQTM